VAENEKYLSSHEQFMETAYRFFSCPHPEISENGLEIIANLGRFVVLQESNVHILNTLWKYLNEHLPDVVVVALECFSKISESAHNHEVLAKYSTIEISQWVSRLVELLVVFSQRHELVAEIAIACLFNLVALGTMRIKTLIASSGCITPLIYYLSYPQKQQEPAQDKEEEANTNTPSISEMAAKTLYQLASEPKNHPLFVPHEENLIRIALQAEPIAHIIYDILAELEV
jgi:hypothetical protein